MLITRSGVEGREAFLAHFYPHAKAAFAFVSRSSVYTRQVAEAGFAAQARRIVDPFVMKLVAALTSVVSPSPAFTEAMRRRAIALSVDFDDVQSKAASFIAALRAPPVNVWNS